MTAGCSDEQEIERLRAAVNRLSGQHQLLKKRELHYQRHLDRFAAATPTAPAPPPDFSGLTLVIAYYDIPDQIERTLLSCSPAYQGADPSEIEVIIADNGSSTAPREDLRERFPFVSRILRTEGRPSPVFALNEAMRLARHSMVGLMIDGAHMLSPGVFRGVKEVCGLFPRPVVNVPQYILGKVSQNLTSTENAFQEESDALAQLNWPEEGYRIFEYAVYPGESPNRSYMSAVESNCLIAPKAVFDELGGFDERFDEPGAGFANLELFSRLIHDPGVSYVLLPGEGSFHQDHGGTTTRKSPEQRNRLVSEFRQKHEQITGSDVLVNVRTPFLYGETRRLIEQIPTVSHQYGQAKQKILRQLADLYVTRAAAGLWNQPEPHLTVGGAPDERLSRPILSPLGVREKQAAAHGVDDAALSYTTFLKRLHDDVRPQLYFEIGVDMGLSLKLAKCRSVGVDPSFCVNTQLEAPVRLFRITSDAFFRRKDLSTDVLEGGIDLAFIDGMHLAEYVLRDFINTEKWMNRNGVVVFDDVLPEQMEMASRSRGYNAWCGDVYKIIPVLRRYRPDLVVHAFEAFIGPYRKGVAVVANLDPENDVLERRYDEIAADLIGDAYNVEDIAALEEIVRVSPHGAFDELLLKSVANNAS